jgi:putative SOS response-associated peptidase YedK
MIPHAWQHGHMCGRYASTKTASDIAEEFQAIDATDGADPGADYNVAPTKPVRVVVERHPRDADGTVDASRTERSVRVMRWGLVPSWSKDPTSGVKMINARAETAATKPAYRKAMAARRCLIPADGWYEWQQAQLGPYLAKAPTRQPYFITGTDGASLAMAGLWEFWRPAGGGEPLITVAVLTTDAVGPLAQIHHRMPRLVPASDWADWLNPDLGGSAERVTRLLAPPSEHQVAALEQRPVSTLVNNVRNGGPELWNRVDPTPAASELALDLG